MDRLDKLTLYVADRMAEPGTWQGVAFLFTLFGSHYASLDWGQAASIGAGVSAAIKIIFKD
jgi:hypothetical protein